MFKTDICKSAVLIVFVLQGIDLWFCLNTLSNLNRTNYYLLLILKDKSKKQDIVHISSNIFSKYQVSKNAFSPDRVTTLWLGCLLQWTLSAIVKGCVWLNFSFTMESSPRFVCFVLSPPPSRNFLFFVFFRIVILKHFLLLKDSIFLNRKQNFPIEKHNDSGKFSVHKKIAHPDWQPFFKISVSPI